MTGFDRSSAAANTMPVVVIHGAMRSQVGLWPTVRSLKRRGFDARAFGYTTRRGTLEDHALRLAATIDAWMGERPSWSTLGFLTHSMGALVVRGYLQSEASRRQAKHHRVVMLSPPNQGSTLARRLARRRWFRTVYGDAATILAADQPPRPIPEHASVLVLAGGRGDSQGVVNWLPGDNDGVVVVDEMRLDGARFEYVYGAHSWLQWRPAVLDRAATFLREESTIPSANS